MNRLELIKLVYRHDRTPEDAIERAKKLEEYLNGDPEKDNLDKPSRGRPKKV